GRRRSVIIQLTATTTVVGSIYNKVQKIIVLLATTNLPTDFHHAIRFPIKSHSTGSEDRT
ncbi:Uncharacterized protein FWK35_00019977, partial [Aphis craccivora]